MRIEWLTIAAVACEPWLSGDAPHGGDSGLVGQEAIVVSPDALDFGTISVNDDGFSTQRFSITNAGDATVAIHGHDEVVTLSGAQGEVFEVAADPVFELEPGNSQEIQVAFRPTTESSWTAEIRVNYGVEVLSLQGAATAPVVSVSQPDDAPWVAPFGCESVLSFTIGNLGSEDLQVQDLWLADTTHYAVSDQAIGERVGPGESLAFDLRFAPQWLDTGGGQLDSLLYVQTNDPATPIATTPLNALAYEGPRITDTFSYAPGMQADVLFAVDTDGIMQAHLPKAVAAADDLIDALDDGRIDLHLAVLTGASTCPTGGPTTSEDGRSTRIAALQDGFEGPQGAYSDRLLQLASAGLQGGCLDDFLRPGAQLHLVVIAGDADASGIEAAEQLSALGDLAPNASDVVVSAVIATDGTGCGGVEYGAGYAEAALQSQGAVEDLCLSDWAPLFVDLADVSVFAAQGGLSQELSHEPILDSLSVKVDGKTWQAWTYDQDDNAVVFSAEAAPDAGSTVEVSYNEAVDCE